MSGHFSKPLERMEEYDEEEYFCDWCNLFEVRAFTFADGSHRWYFCSDVCRDEFMDSIGMEDNWEVHKHYETRCICCESTLIKLEGRMCFKCKNLYNVRYIPSGGLTDEDEE